MTTKTRTLYEIQLGQNIYYATGRNEDAAAAKVQKNFGTRWTHAFPTGTVKFRGDADC